MRRYRGTPVIVCECVRPRGWPLFTIKHSPFMYRDQKMNHWTGWHLEYLHAPSDDELKGRCPQCKRNVHAVFANSYKAFYEGLDDLKAEEELEGEELIRALETRSDPGACSHGYTVGISKDGTRVYYSVMEIYSANVRIVPSSVRVWRPEKPVYIDLPFGTFEQRFNKGKVAFELKADTKAKQDFALAVLRVLRLQFNGTELPIPSWEPNATDACFARWTEELDAALKDQMHTVGESRMALRQDGRACSTQAGTIPATTKSERDVELPKARPRSCCPHPNAVRKYLSVMQHASPISEEASNPSGSLREHTAHIDDVHLDGVIGEAN